MLIKGMRSGEIPDPAGIADAPKDESEHAHGPPGGGMDGMGGMGM